MLSYKLKHNSAVHIKSKSWVKKDRQTIENLIHEQYHFNISEVFARRMRKAMEAITEPTTENIQKIFDEWIKKYREEQIKYDLETEHSKNFSEQERWQIKIDRELKDLEKYKNVVVILNQ